MTFNERRQCWRDLKEELQTCFDRASDLLATQVGQIGIHDRLVCRLAERSVLRICDSIIEAREESHDAF
jgi:hypothetical protein